MIYNAIHSNDVHCNNFECAISRGIVFVMKTERVPTLGVLERASMMWRMFIDKEKRGDIEDVLNGVDANALPPEDARERYNNLIGK